MVMSSATRTWKMTLLRHKVSAQKFLPYPLSRNLLSLLLTWSLKRICCEKWSSGGVNLRETGLIEGKNWTLWRRKTAEKKKHCSSLRFLYLHTLSCPANQCSPLKSALFASSSYTWDPHVFHVFVRIDHTQETFFHTSALLLQINCTPCLSVTKSQERDHEIGKIKSYLI